MKKKIPVLIVFVMALGLLNGCKGAPAAEAGSETLYQVSTLDALMQGVYDGEISLDELTSHGGFGIGTFEGLDGEMVVLDGNVYQVLSTGEVVLASGSVKTPFAMVTDFEADIESDGASMDYEGLKAEIDGLLPSPNKIYAIKVEGTFTYVKTRSVPKQSEPYPTLAEVTATQPIFEFNDVKGTLVGYWCPEYLEGVNLPGYHLHFISEDRKMGGHLLEFTAESCRIAIDTTTEFNMLLPENEHFSGIDLNKTSEEEARKVEQ